MNAPANLPDLTAAARDRAQRHDGWTPERQRAFLEAIAEGHTVDSAARLVGLSAASAYAFRRRAPAATFAIGWGAANLLARERLAATLYARAVDGQVETVTRADGSTIARHRFDNRLASTMLARLDRQAEDPDCGAATEAARLVAQEFDAFLDVIERDEGPARTGLFLGTRAAGASDLAPIVSLARADRYCRTGVALAGEVATADLDIAHRAEWTADQWQRAEAAGLLVLGTPPEEEAGGPQLSQLHGDAEDEDAEEEEDWGDEPRVFWDGGEWRTNFPPPKDFWGDEEGTFGRPDYSRSLSDEELKAYRAQDEGVSEEERDADAHQRDRYFGFVEDAPAPAAPPPPALAAPPPPPNRTTDDDGLAEFDQFIADMNAEIASD